ncbi:putative tannase subunit protein [Botrytis fragariae]|uniref:Carboxylic ester hydrolase n=1 Tax=Botrytis fragariae TaxID=1964551 RepID=A0A8H6AYN5_9HELO|nr:putative tannase subunit protein [Botrytis fragariae]KAF5875917.1 putative tannase subunit protein [Botrytis fragariae]
MRRSITALATFATCASAATNITESLVQLCTVANSEASLPTDGIAGITMVPSLKSANIYNATDSVLGGGGGQAYLLSTDPLGGLIYGAVGGMTSAGYDNANSAYDEAALLANETINWPATMTRPLVLVSASAKLPVAPLLTNERKMELDSWVLDIPSTGSEYIVKLIELLNIDNLLSIDNVIYDTMIEWMNTGMAKYYDSLQTTLPDLTPCQSSKGKLLHYHSESDPSIPTTSSVHYWQSFRSVMYPDLSEDDSLAALADLYQFYLIPGATHCGANTLQPDGLYPKDNIHTMIDWVEKGIKPTALNTTVGGGAVEGDAVSLCQWPTRPLFHSNTSSGFDCVNDARFIEAWTYSFPAFKIPVY